MFQFLRMTLPAIGVASLCLPALGQPVDPNASNQFNWNQTTGLVNIPIARSLRRGTFFGAFDFKSRSLSTLFGSEFLADPDDGGNGSFHFLFSPIRNVELAVMGLHDVDRGGNVDTFGRLLTIPPARDFSTALKWVVSEETDNMPSIAVGVENLTYPYPGASRGRDDKIPDARLKDKGFYAVGSKSFPVGDQMLSVHLGFGTGRFLNRPFGGLEYAFENGLALLGEYDGWQGTYGLRYTGLRNLRLTAAVQGGQPTLQIGYMFNPFDLFSQGDQDDYNPYAMPNPVGRNEDDPWPKDDPEPDSPLDKSEKMVNGMLEASNQVAAEHPVSVPPPPEPKEPPLVLKVSTLNHTSPDPEFQVRPTHIAPEKGAPPKAKAPARPATAPKSAPTILRISLTGSDAATRPVLKLPKLTTNKKAVPKSPVGQDVAAASHVKKPAPIQNSRPVARVAVRPSRATVTVKVASDDDAREFGRAENLGGYSRHILDEDNW